MEDYEAASRPLTNTSSKSFPGSFYCDSPPEYGMGLYQGKVHGQSVVEHYGSISGYRSTLTQYPDLGLGFALLTNSNEGERLCAWLRGILSDGAHGASVPDKRWEEQSEIQLLAE